MTSAAEVAGDVVVDGMVVVVAGSGAAVVGATIVTALLDVVGREYGGVAVVLP